MFAVVHWLSSNTTDEIYVVQVQGLRTFASLTGAVGGLTLQGHDLVFLFIRLHRQVRQVLLHLSCHLSVFVQLLGIEQGAAAHSFLVGAALHVQHVGVGASLTQGPYRGNFKGTWEEI